LCFDSNFVLGQKPDMTDSNDIVVRQILAEIGKHGGTTGVSFHQRPDAAPRYPTEAILTVVRMLAEEAEAANDSAMAAGLRAMLKEVDPNLPIEIEFAGTGPLPCITEGQTEHGYWWRYAPSQDEPGENLVMALRLAADVASEQARNSGNTYVVATVLQPSPAVHVFACDHPDAGNAGIDIMFEFLPDGRRIPHEHLRRRP
jgi:hypothetical protein